MPTAPAQRRTPGIAPGATGCALKVEPVSARLGLRSDPANRTGTPLLRLSVRLSTPRMGGFVELRLPEVLRSSRGYHFLDHFHEFHPVLADPDPLPEWTCDGDTGRWSYRCSPDGVLAWQASVTPMPDGAALSFSVTNLSSEPLADVEPNCCLLLGGARAFDAPHDLSRLFLPHEGRLLPMTACTPTPGEKGRGAWFLFLTERGDGCWKGGTDSPTWWLAEQRCDRALLAACSACGGPWLGYAWEGEPATMMSNCGYPCLHTGPGPVDLGGDGASQHWRGAVFLVEGGSDAVLARHDELLRAWAASRVAGAAVD